MPARRGPVRPAVAAPRREAARRFGGASVLEVCADHDGETFRAADTVRSAQTIYVLHALQKKSKSGVATPRAARALAPATGRGTMKRRSTEPVEPGGGNVLADLGRPEPAVALAEAQLAHRIVETIVARKLTQAAAARLLGVDQPKVSRLVRGDLAGLSTDRMLRFLAVHSASAPPNVGRAAEKVVRARARRNVRRDRRGRRSPGREA